MKLKVFQGKNYKQLSESLDAWKECARIFSINTLYIEKENLFDIFVYYELIDLESEDI